MKSYCSLQIWVLSYVLKSLTEEVGPIRLMTVTTHAAVIILFFFCFHSRSLQHTLHYIFHGTLVLCVFGATYCCGCIIDMSKSLPRFFRCISKKKNIVLYSGQYGNNKEFVKCLFYCTLSIFVYIIFVCISYCVYLTFKRPSTQIEFSI